MRDDLLASIKGKAEDLLYREPCRLMSLMLEVDGSDCSARLREVRDDTPFDRPTEVPLDVLEFYIELYEDAVRGINPGGVLDGAATFVSLTIDTDRVAFSASDGHGSSVTYSYEVPYESPDLVVTQEVIE